MAESVLSWLRYARDSLWLNMRLSPPRYLLEHEMKLPKLRGVSLRPYVQTDFESCRLMYEDAHPKGSAESLLYLAFFLRNHPDTVLVAEHGGKIIGCVSYLLPRPDHAVLCAKWVRREYQRMGVGRLLFFGMVAQMPLIQEDTRLHIVPDNQAWAYYEQYHFNKAPVPVKNAVGKEYEYAVLVVNTYIIQASRRYLQTAKVPLPDLSDLPPIRQELKSDSASGQAGEDTVAQVYEH